MVFILVVNQNKNNNQTTKYDYWRFSGEIFPEFKLSGELRGTLGELKMGCSPVLVGVWQNLRGKREYPYT